MRSYNRIILMGRVTHDPEMKYTDRQTPISTVGLAINEIAKKGDHYEDRVVFVEVVMWRRNAEIACKFLHKGDPIFIDGKLRMDIWKKDGKTKNRLKVVCNHFVMLGGKRWEESRMKNKAFDSFVAFDDDEDDQDSDTEAEKKPEQKPKKRIKYKKKAKITDKNIPF